MRIWHNCISWFCYICNFHCVIGNTTLCQPHSQYSLHFARLLSLALSLSFALCLFFFLTFVLWKSWAVFGCKVAKRAAVLDWLQRKERERARRKVQERLVWFWSLPELRKLKALISLRHWPETQFVLYVKVFVVLSACLSSLPFLGGPVSAGNTFAANY